MADSGAPVEASLKRAFYIKLGVNGRWAADSIESGLVRFSWSEVPLRTILARDWGSVRSHLAEKCDHKGTITADTARLRDIAESTSEDVWIAFHQSHLWWCRLAPGEVEEDETSRFRRVLGAWSCEDSSGTPLLANQIPGGIARIQRFSGTVCSVREVEALHRLLSGERSIAYNDLETASKQLVEVVLRAMRVLHWKDFETLVDLVFREAGWRRVSVLGESMKYADLELEEPITGDRYQVQVKAEAGVPDFAAYAAQFSGKGFRKLYFVVHSPSTELELSPPSNDSIELVLPGRLAKLVVNQGLVGWLQGRIR